MSTRVPISNPQFAERFAVQTHPVFLSYTLLLPVAVVVSAASLYLNRILLVVRNMCVHAYERERERKKSIGESQKYTSRIFEKKKNKQKRIFEFDFVFDFIFNTIIVHFTRFVVLIAFNQY